MGLGRCRRTQTDTVWYFPSALSPTMQFSGFGHVPLPSEQCVRSTRPLVIPEGVNEAKEDSVGWVDGWMGGDGVFW